MSRSLVRGRSILCGIRPDGTGEIIDEGAVLIEHGTVLAVDRFDVLRSMHPDCMVLGSGRDVVAPGFVNAHHHVGLTPFQLGAPDLPLELWLAAKIGLRDVDPYLDTLFSAFEMIESGVTTVQHLHVSRSSVSDLEMQSGAILAAYRDIGMRVSYSYGYRDQNRLVYEADETFLARLPSALADEARPWFKNQDIQLSDHLELFEDLLRRYGGTADGRIALQLAPANLHWCSDDAIGQLAGAADRHRVPMHMHLVETRYQQAYAHRRTGKSAVAHLAALGVLGPRTTLGHAIWIDGDDLDLLADTGTCVCHNASSNFRLRSGIAPCGHFLKRGIPVAIGIDEAGINDDRDMLQEMRLVLRLHRTPGLNEADVPSGADVWRMATEHGAQTTPFADRIGRIAPGLAADMVLYDWEKIASPYLDHDIPLVDALVYRAKQGAIRQVLIAGCSVYQDGVFSFADRAAVLSEIRTALERPPSEAEVRRRSMSRALSPFVRNFYETYDEVPHA